MTIAQLKAYLHQPYPFYYKELKRVFFFLSLIAAASFLFTYLFEPFVVNVDEHKIDGFWIMILHSVIPIPVAFAYFYWLNTSVRNIENWTLGKEFLHLAIILLLIGIASFLIRDVIYSNPDNWSFRYLFEEIRNTFLVGVLLLLLILPLNLHRLIRKHTSGLMKLPTHQLFVQETASTVQISTPIKEENFELNVPSFLYAKVDGNYVELFYDSSSSKEKDLKRLTLKEFEDQLSACPFIFRVHRSYVVNLKAIESISGNAQGYALHLHGHSYRTVPVSRSRIEEFNQLYTTLKNK